MEKIKQKIIVVCGPTATGKSDLAVAIAQKIKGEVISADSRQVYRGMNLGTGKITEREMQGIPHHLLDVASPKNIFSVSDFVRLAEKAIEEISSAGHVPIVCGGTGFYIDALVSGQSIPEVPPNKKLRKELSGKTADVLFAKLKKIDSARAKTIDAKNPVRLVRAIEIATALGKVPKIKLSSKYDALYIGLDTLDEVLKHKIHTRLLSRMKSGMLREARKLKASGVSWRRMEELGLEYRYMALHLQNKLSKNEMLTELESEVWQYAKRQRTWFKRNKNILWLDPRRKGVVSTALQASKKFLSR